MARATLILTRRDIAGFLPLVDCVDAVESAFARHADGAMLLPEVVHIPGSGGAFHVKSAGFAGPPSYVAVKVNGNFPDNPALHGLPTIQGAIVLCDGSDGFPLAIMDSSEITAMRTAAATAVAARHLADPRASTATVIGCGVQGRAQLEALLLTLPLERVFVYDTDARRCAALAGDLGRRAGAAIVPAEGLAEATSRSQVIVTCTTSRRAFLGPEQVRPGSFVAAVGADAEDKQELFPELLRGSRVVVDILEQCAQIGDLHHAIASGAMTRSDVAAELGEVVLGIKPGRTSPADIVVFDSTGSAIQDVAVAGRIFERAREKNVGTRVELA